MKTHSILATALLALLVACGGSTRSYSSAKVPTTFVSDVEDGWLHEHCRFVEVARLGQSESADQVAERLDANFVELVGETERNMLVKVFRCANKPTWYVANRDASILDER